MTAALLDDLAWRGLLQDQTPGLQARLARGPIAGYIGFDPTAPSLQVGNLIPIMLLAHLQRVGGKPIVVVGGGTGMIGDPSGKRDERPLLDADRVAEHAGRQRRQLERFLDFTPGPRGAEIVDNAEWLRPLELLPFLRDIGKHFTLSYMLQKESVKQRLDAGISYTEFSYMLLQAYDFLQLFRTRRCELQLGGSDQWGNITAGIELIRRVDGGEAHGLSAPLLTTAGGAKFGKSEAGAVWLDPNLTSPYRFYQFWLNADDRDVDAYVKAFTFLPRTEIADLMRRHAAAPADRLPHRTLAQDITERVHGREACGRAVEAARIVFGELDPKAATPEVWRLLATDLPSAPLPPGTGEQTPVVELVTEAEIVKSKGEARRLIQQGGLYVNGERVASADAVAGPALAGGFYWIRSGKKQQFILSPAA
ncbi:MAG TPA: tyrosine--tRNA ligase [Gemmatimonadales bacterium]